MANGNGSSSGQTPQISDSSVFETIQATQKATLIPEIQNQGGAGKTFLSVSQTAAITIQDAGDNLRNMTTVSSTAIGVALAKSLANPEKASLYAETITQAQSVVKSAADTFKTVGSNAADVLKGLQAVVSG